MKPISQIPSIHHYLFDTSFPPGAWRQKNGRCVNKVSWPSYEWHEDGQSFNRQTTMSTRTTTTIHRSVKAITKHLFFFCYHVLKHFITFLWRQPGVFKVKVKDTKQASILSCQVWCTLCIHSLSPQAGPPEIASNQTNNHMAQSADSNTHICLAVLKNRAETLGLQSTLRHNKVWHYIYPDAFFFFFPQSRNPNLFSVLSDKTEKKNKKTVAYYIQTFRFSILFILKKALLV